MDWTKGQKIEFFLPCCFIFPNASTPNRFLCPDFMSGIAINPMPGHKILPKKILADNDLLQFLLIKFDAQPWSFRHHCHPGFKFKRLLEQHIAT